MEGYKPGRYMDFTWEMSFADEFFDMEWYQKCENKKQEDLLKENYSRYKDEPMADYIVEYWKKLGIQKDFYTEDFGRENRREGHHYSVLHPMNLKEKKYPVIYFSHAGGQDSFDAEYYGLAERMAEEDFLYVCPNRYGAEEFERILGEMKKNDYPIDESRIYVMGFSGGSASSMEIALAHPEKIAGIAVMPGPNSFNQMNREQASKAFLENDKLQMPIICIGGARDGGDRWPLADETAYDNFNFWMQKVSKLPGFQPVSRDQAKWLMENAQSKVEQAFGLPFEKSYINEMDDTFCYVGDYFNPDGTVIARFCSVAGLPHGVFPAFTGVAWAFLKKFSRNPGDSALNYEKKEMDFRTRRKKEKD